MCIGKSELYVFVHSLCWNNRKKKKNSSGCLRSCRRSVGTPSAYQFWSEPSPAPKSEGLAGQPKWRSIFGEWIDVWCSALSSARAEADSSYIELAVPSAVQRQPVLYHTMMMFQTSFRGSTNPHRGQYIASSGDLSTSRI